ncbi:hypothetical protein N183_17970 [Sinorhizobium sp. Sb3]|nr:hypothetical protein N183_17970 [Sinorhizobium sp. Sb3]
MAETAAEEIGARDIAEDIAELQEGHRIVLGGKRRLVQPVGALVVEDDRLAAVGRAGEVAAPQCRNQRQTDDIFAAR